jgi:iron complex outermembrane receptor protein
MKRTLTAPVSTGLHTIPRQGTASAHRTRRLLIALAALALLPGSLAAQEKPAGGTAPEELGSSVVVVGDSQVLHTQAVTAAETKVAEIAGGASLVDTLELSDRRVSGVADALKFVPGVTAQSRDGGEATRLTLRGSGLVRGATAFGQGVSILFDGLPLATGAGYIYDPIEPVFAEYIEVLRGANSFQHGPVSLGGSVNYVTRTGYTAPGLFVSAQIGADGYFKAQASAGQVRGPFDYYVSATDYDYDGYRVNNAMNSHRYVLSAGYKFGDRLSTRLIYRYDTTTVYNPAGSLTKAQIKRDPTANSTVDQSRLAPGTHIVENLTTLALDARSQLTFGALWAKAPGSNEGGANPSSFEQDDLTTRLAYSRDDALAGGHRSLTSIAYLYGKLLYYRNRDYRSGALVSAQRGIGQDSILQAENTTQLTERWWLLSGLAAVWQERGGYTELRAAKLGTGLSDNVDDDYANLAPRLGLRWDATPKVQYYANVSRSVEAPITQFYRQSKSNNYTGMASFAAQTSTSFEVGTRGEHSVFAWDLSLYRADVKNEFLTVNLTPGVVPGTTSTRNASPTIHQGVEAALEITLYNGAAAAPVAGVPRRSNRLSLRQAYTVNDFFYQHDSEFGRNRLAGVARQLYQAELKFDAAHGWYAAVNTEAAPVRSPADFANTIYSDAYIIFGARLGYAPLRGKWKLYVDFQNLGDTRYASQISPTYNALGADSAVYAPGLGRSYTIGASYTF